MRGDPRFGDIRIASVPLDSELFATSISSLEVVDGTWVGDIIFNSNKQFKSVDDVFAVALHEAGHVFGLEHNENPKSPMFMHGIPVSTIPTAEDISLVQSIFGPRSPDVFDSERPDAIRVRGFELPDQSRGSAPSLLFGDI